MATSKPAIVFMGTPEFAVESLKAVIGAGYPVKAVVTSPDKPSGRGLQLHASPVKEYALENHLTVLQPFKLKDESFIHTLQSLHADIQVVVAFRMLPFEIWSMPPLGTFNLHASLLPQYRGAAPINWAVMNGEEKTGVTTFYINHEIDQGSVIFTEETRIEPDETAGDLHDRLMVLGARLVMKTIRAIENGTADKREQHLITVEGPLKSAPKIHRNNCKIKWDSNIHTVYNFIRGLSPYPGAWSEIVSAKGETLIAKIYYATAVRCSHEKNYGTVETDGKTYLSVAARDGFVHIERIQLQGKNQMGVAEFLRGFPLPGECSFQ
jgi:methionyl-tRNA formyltransferase